MRIESGRIINDFIEPNKRQYVIPVYQRNYEWDREQCVKLFEDIVNAYYRDRTHFCGSIVYTQIKEEHGIIYYVIVDGQQRLTTIYLLLKALIDCAETENEREKILESMLNKDKFSEFGVEEASKLKLKPIKTDNQQLYLLMENHYEQMDKTSGIWINYCIFKEQITALLNRDGDMVVKKIYNGIEKLICAKIQLDPADNAQEIFERINSTGVPLSLSDQIRNYVLMTDVNQEKLYEEYWVKVEQLVSKDKMSAFFMDYLNFKMDGFTRENQAYEDFKKIYSEKHFTNESILQEITHYAEFYNVFLYGSDKYSKKINETLEALRLLKQTTVYLFLFRVFNDYANNEITQAELEKILDMLVSYSVRRLMCEISSNSLRGMYKTLYNRVFAQPENKEHYYDSVVSFLMQTTSKDVIPTDEDFIYALKNNNLYQKHALCRFLLIAIENQGKEKIVTDSLSIEHIMPQNKNLSTSWQRMLGENWQVDKDRWLHTLGNLTLTGYNSELGDRPFLEKKKMIEETSTKAVILYQDVQDKDTWNAELIQKRADRLAQEAVKLFSVEKPSKIISFVDPRYKEYTCADPENARFKIVNYYELEGERVAVDSFALMVRSVAKKLYDKDPSIIKRMARTGESFNDWTAPVFSYDENGVNGDVKLTDTDIYISTGYSARKCVSFIRGLLQKYDLNIEEDFVYSARTNTKEGMTAKKREYWEYALPIIKNAHKESGCFAHCNPIDSDTISGSFGVGGFSILCVGVSDGIRVSIYLGKSDPVENKEAFDYLYAQKNKIEEALKTKLDWERGEMTKVASCFYRVKGININNEEDWTKAAELHANWSKAFYDVFVPLLRAWGHVGEENNETVQRLLTIADYARQWGKDNEKISINLQKSVRTYTRFNTVFSKSLFPDIENAPSGWSTPNHCFYEVVNRTGNSFFVQLAISSKNISEEQRAIADLLSDKFRKSNPKEDWQWRTPFKSSTKQLPEALTKESIYNALDECLKEIYLFEEEVKKALSE